MFVCPKGHEGPFVEKRRVSAEFLVDKHGDVIMPKGDPLDDGDHADDLPTCYVCGEYAEYREE